MLLFRPEVREPRTYSLDEAAEFLEFDRESVAYWLRMGHIEGRQDKRSGEWRIQPHALIEFLRESQEPLPTALRQPEYVAADRTRTAVGA